MFGTFSASRPQRGVAHDAQRRRFLARGPGGQIRYVTLLVEALDLERVLDQLDAVLCRA